MKQYTKEAAALYLGISISKLLHHRHKTGLFPRGRLNDFGVLIWEKRELDAFKKVNAQIKRGYHAPVGVESITPKRFRRTVKTGARITRHGKQVLSCERGLNDRREYLLEYADGSSEYARDNVRLRVERKPA
jgi:hypothetical protein